MFSLCLWTISVLRGGSVTIMQRSVVIGSTRIVGALLDPTKFPFLNTLRHSYLTERRYLGNSRQDMGVAPERLHSVWIDLEGERLCSLFAAPQFAARCA
jgi:hypothetical protein